MTAVAILGGFLILVFLLQDDRCIMGQQRSFRKRKPTSWCVKGRSFTSALTSRVCKCRDSDFLWWALPLPPGSSSTMSHDDLDPKTRAQVTVYFKEG